MFKCLDKMKSTKLLFFSLANYAKRGQNKEINKFLELEYFICYYLVYLIF